LQEADNALAASEAAKRSSDEAVDAARAALEEAEAYLNEVKNKPGTPCPRNSRGFIYFFLFFIFFARN
tara:strand:- start:555 stop:758 length:204 start_codon:yes stop_codon:yes gene_type:complete